MDRQRLKYLNKTQLLDLLYQQEVEIQSLTTEKEELAKCLEERRLAVANAGSIAEASVALGGILQAAQNTADIYLENIRAMEEESRIATEHEIKEARRKATAIITEARQKCEKIEAQEKKTVDSLWEDFQQRLDQYVKAHAEVRELAGIVNQTTSALTNRVAETTEEA